MAKHTAAITAVLNNTHPAQFVLNLPIHSFSFPFLIILLLLPAYCTAQYAPQFIIGEMETKACKISLLLRPCNALPISPLEADLAGPRARNHTQQIKHQSTEPPKSSLRFTPPPQVATSARKTSAGNVPAEFPYASLFNTTHKVVSQEPVDTILSEFLLVAPYSCNQFRPTSVTHREFSTDDDVWHVPYEILVLTQETQRGSGIYLRASRIRYQGAHIARRLCQLL